MRFSGLFFDFPAFSWLPKKTLNSVHGLTPVVCWSTPGVLQGTLTMSTSYRSNLYFSELKISKMNKILTFDIFLDFSLFLHLGGQFSRHRSQLRCQCDHYRLKRTPCCTFLQKRLLLVRKVLILWLEIVYDFQSKD